jgi:hypothetical protein
MRQKEKGERWKYSRIKGIHFPFSTFPLFSGSAERDGQREDAISYLTSPKHPCLSVFIGGSVHLGHSTRQMGKLSLLEKTISLSHLAHL